MSVRSQSIGAFLGSLTALCLTACDTVDIERYEHQPSERFYETSDFQAEELASFTDDGVLFVVDVNQVTHSDYIVWLGLYSTEAGKAVDIRSASILGGPTESVRSDYGEITLVSDGEFFGNSVRLFEVTGKWLADAVSPNEQLAIVVTYSTGASIKELQFSLARRTETYFEFLLST